MNSMKLSLLSCWRAVLNGTVDSLRRSSHSLHPTSRLVSNPSKDSHVSKTSWLICRLDPRHGRDSWRPSALRWLYLIYGPRHPVRNHPHVYVAIFPSHLMLTFFSYRFYFRHSETFIDQMLQTRPPVGGTWSPRQPYL